MSVLITKKNVSLVAAALLVALLLIVVGRFLSSVSPRLGSIRLDADSNTILDIFTIERGSNVYRAKYRDPASFEDYVFVFDPDEVHFDSYSVNYVRRDGARTGGMRSHQGAVFPQDGSKRMISLPGSSGMRSRWYTQPSSSRDRSFVSAITVQFFYTRGDRSEEEHREALDKFHSLDTKGQFMVLRRGRYIPVAISTKPYR